MRHFNYFKILGLPVQPCIDESALKANYLKLSVSVHPDREGGHPDEDPEQPDAALVNEAQRILSHTPSRLKHLLTLQTGSAPGNLRQVPDELGDFFMEIGALLHKLDTIIKDKPGEDASELSRILFLKKSMSIRQLVESMLKKINQQIDRLQLQLESLNEGWNLIETDHTISPELSRNLTPLYHEWTFFERWRGQLSERLLEMTV